MRNPTAWIVALCSLSLSCSKPATCPGGPDCLPEVDPKKLPEKFCPGQDGCKLGNDGNFQAGTGKRDVSPVGYEVAIDEYLETKGACDGKRCGALQDIAYKDCGRDMICPGQKNCGTDKLCPNDAGYPGPDADGSERVHKSPDADGSEKDGVLDFFKDCGRDRLCPGDTGYKAPDADGSEKNGKFDGFWLAGFQNGRPMQSIHDPIWARAYAIKNGDVTVAHVVIDSVGIFYEHEALAVRKKAAGMGVDLDYLFVGSTHVHEAPDTLGQWGIANTDYGVFRGVDEAWMDFVTTKAAEAVKDAVADLKPAKARFAVARTGYDGWARDSRDPIVFDDRITLMQLIERDGGKTIATVSTYGNHPETMSDWNNASTSDFPGFFRDALEKGLPAVGGKPSIAGLGGTSVYLSGAVGGLITSLGVPITGRDGKVYDKGFAKTQAQGEILAEAALLALATAKEVAPEMLSITVRAQTLKLPVDNIAFRVAFDAFKLFNRPVYELSDETGARSIKTEIGVVTVGPGTFVSIPGEIFPELTVGFDQTWAHGKPQIDPKNVNPPDLNKTPKGPFLLEMFKNEFVFPCGLTNDEMGYFVPPYDFKLHETDPYFSQAPGDHYEETNGLGPNTVPKLLEVYTKIRDAPLKERRLPPVR